MGYEAVADSEDYFAADLEVILQKEVVGAVYASLDGVFDGNNSMFYVSCFDAFEDFDEAFAGLHLNRGTEKAVDCTFTIRTQFPLKSNFQF